MHVCIYTCHTPRLHTVAILCAMSSMYVLCMYIYTYIHVSIYTYIHIYLHTQIHVHTHTYMYKYIYTCIYIYTYIYMHVRIYTCHTPCLHTAAILRAMSSISCISSFKSTWPCGISDGACVCVCVWVCVCALLSAADCIESRHIFCAGRPEELHLLGVGGFWGVDCALVSCDMPNVDSLSLVFEARSTRQILHSTDTHAHMNEVKVCIEHGHEAKNWSSYLCIRLLIHICTDWYMYGCIFV